MSTGKPRRINKTILAEIEGSLPNGRELYLEGEFKLRINEGSVTLTGNPENVKIDYRNPDAK